LKQYQISEIPSEAWKALDAVIWRTGAVFLPNNSAFDGLIPEAVETTKYGVRISGILWLLPTAKFQTTLLLARPRFSSILDFTPKKLGSATIQLSCLEDDGSLSIEIG
jgi:hypothetical protein